jgi:type 1 glutamine amidotransferase
VLVLGQARAYENDSTSDAMGTIWKLGRDSGTFDAFLVTDTEWITKTPTDKKRNNKNLNTFDAVVFVNTSGELDLNDRQKADLLSFIHEDGKGFVGVHALETFAGWPEYAKMLGATFAGHAWGTLRAPIVVEDPAFPAVAHFPGAFTIKDEIDVVKTWSREEINVLLRMDESKLDYAAAAIPVRPDHDFPVAWSKMYGKGRVFYSTFGHVPETWTNADVQKMYLEGIKWALRLTEGSATAHHRPATD